MTQSKSKLLGELLQAKDGFVRTETLNKSGFSSRDIRRFLDEGKLKKIKQGYYTRKAQDISDIQMVANLIPMGVMCLFTAVEFYDLATVNPSEICVALPRGATCPALPPNLFVKIHHMTQRHFEAGITQVAINGATVRMYDIEKTVFDCFKYNNEVEKGIALEVLKSYISRGNCNIHKFLEYAKLFGKSKTINPYVEALI